VTTRSLHLAKDLRLPLDAVTETFAILGRRGSGKTHTAVVMAEEMLAAGVQVVVIDPLDVWWGLRVSKDGKAAGFPIYVAGGSHEDIPLPADAGKVLADAIVDRGLSMVLSLRHLSKTDQRRFVGDFCERVYDRKADPKHRTALHVFIDVLSQTEVLVSHQLTGPQDRKALQAWIEANDTENRGAEFMGSLASLQKGDAWFWSPGLLGIFTRVHVRDRHTFDSSATPKPGVQAVASPKAFAAVDLEKLTAEIQATIAKAKADDPRELRKQIAEKDRRIKQLEAGVSNAPAKIPKNIPALTDADRALLEKVGGQIAEVGRLLTVNTQFDVDELLKGIDRQLRSFKTDLHNEQSDNRDAFLKICDGKAFQKLLAKLPEPHQLVGRRGETTPRAPRPARNLEPRPATPRSNGAGGELGKGERVILTAIAQHADGVTGEQLTVLTGYKRSSRDTYIQRLTAGGYVEAVADRILALPSGIAALGDDFDPLPTGDALRAHWLDRLPEGERKILELLCRHYPDPVDRERISDATGYKRSSRDTYLQRLGARRLITTDRAGVRASEELFS